MNRRHACARPVQFREQADLGLKTRRLYRDVTHYELLTRRLARFLGLRPDVKHVLMAERDVAGGGVYVPPRVRVQLYVAVNSPVHHHPAPAPRF